MYGIENGWAFLVVAFGLIIAPGPDILYVLARGVAEGRSAALAAAAGFSLGNIFHLTLVTLGVSALIAASDQLLFIIKIAGAGYLAWIAWQLWNSPLIKVETAETSMSKASSAKVFKQSVVANLLNPKVILFFLALFPQFIDQTADRAWIGIVVLGCIFIIMTWIIFSLVGLFAGRLNGYLKTKPEIGQWVPKGSAILLLLIALLIIMN